MALSRRATGRFANSIWPGFVDAMTALILVLFFVLSIFMIVQFVLRDTISGQGRELDELSLQVANLADALGLARSRADRQEALVATVSAERDAAQAEVAEFEAQVASLLARNTSLSDELDEAGTRIASFEEQVASLLARNEELGTQLETAEAESAERLAEAEDLQSSLESARATLSEQEAAAQEAARRREALELALAQARDEIDAEAEAARLAAARREALEALVVSLRSDVEGLEGELAASTEQLSEAEAAQLAEAAAAEELRERLANADAELTAMTLNLEEERRRAEETLTLLAAAEAARDELQDEEEAAAAATDARAAQLAQARALLAEEEEISAEAQREVALLNQQTAELRSQLNALQGMLDDADARDAAAQVQLERLGANLNAALARVAAEERARAEAEAERAALEARERERLEAEAQDLESYRSEFFGRMREILGDREGVRVVGDRFVFDSEVLFPQGSATLNAAGRAQVERVASVIRDIADDVPEGIDWILRVDGHTDSVPVSPGSPFRDNWELSQARALSVVRYMIQEEDLPADRLAATGFGEFQPIDTGTSPEALARNRRIELKFTER